jgi:hypothetical protein
MQKTTIIAAIVILKQRERPAPCLSFCILAAGGTLLSLCAISSPKFEELLLFAILSV